MINYLPIFRITTTAKPADLQSSQPLASDIRHTAFHPVLICLHKLRMHRIFRRIIPPILFGRKHHGERMRIPIRIAQLRAHIWSCNHFEDIWFAGDWVDAPVFERQHGGRGGGDFCGSEVGVEGVEGYVVDKCHGEWLWRYSEMGKQVCNVFKVGGEARQGPYNLYASPLVCGSGGSVG
jgi:hypothetical protein